MKLVLEVTLTFNSSLVYTIDNGIVATPVRLLGLARLISSCSILLILPQELFLVGVSISLKSRTHQDRDHKVPSHVPSNSPPDQDYQTP